MKSKLNLNLIERLNNTFKDKKWTEIVHYNSFFERYCSFLEHLDENELELILELTNDYEWITDNKYLELLTKSLEKLTDFDYLNLDKVFILPLLSRTDREKNKDKSSRHVSYLCNNVQIKFNPLFKDTEFQLIDNLDHLPKESKISQDKFPVILVDDYIGTGETAVEAIEELFEQKKYEKKYIFVLSLVAQEVGLKVVNSIGLDVLYGILRKKGISDKFDSKDREERLEIMRKLESKLNIDKDFRLGYKSSEALITMIRTPNNTFPIYWHKAKLDSGDNWTAPFPRN
jgi:hypothetical protein